MTALLLAAALRAKISDAYYDARNAGRTMTDAADDAVDAIAPLVAEARATAWDEGLRAANKGADESHNPYRTR